MIPLDPAQVSELAATAIEAQLVQDSSKVVEVLQRILVEGTKRDALGFTVACIYTIACGLTLGEEEHVGPVSVSPAGEVTTRANPIVGQQLFADMLGDYIAGRFTSIRDRWVAAADDEASGAVGVSVWAAASMVRAQRAVYN